MTHVFIGIDPGANGGIAAVDDDGKVLYAARIPDTEADIIAVLRTLGSDDALPARAIIERVSASPQMGVVSAFSFGRGYGVLRMGLIAVGVPFEDVTPGVWQKAMGVRQQTGKTALGSTHKKDKNITKRRAQELFPAVKVTHAISEALLIAEHCRRERGRL